ncbi:MAG: type II toxin-antitoxin system RelE/ParE family toxin [Flavobacterium sp.]
MEIIWSPQAKKDFWNNIDYLEAEWTFDVVVNFIKKVDATVLLLEKDKTLFIKTNYKNVYKVVVTKQISLYYRKKNDSIQLLRFWNNYQNLEKFNYKQTLVCTQNPVKTIKHRN